VLTYARLAQLPLTIDRYSLSGLRVAVSPTFERHTTLVRLEGAELIGLGEDPTYDAADQLSFQEHGAALPLAGTHTLDSFSHLLEALDLFPTGPSQSAYRDYRRWAFESAALDLALRQAGVSLAQQLELLLHPVRFVSSCGLGSPPSLAGLDDWNRIYPDLAWKLDSSVAWDDALCEKLAATKNICVVDFKGAYKGTPVDQPPDAQLYRRVAERIPGAFLEDPAWTEATAQALNPHRERVTWDAPIHSLEDIALMPVRSSTLNMKPSRLGSLARLFAAYDHCRDNGIAIYGGGQFELGVGRGQIQYLASLFHGDAANDVAPIGYNSAQAIDGLATSPLAPSVDPIGFRWQS
jgi:hypothetical protein